MAATQAAGIEHAVCVLSQQGMYIQRQVTIESASSASEPAVSKKDISHMQQLHVL